MAAAASEQYGGDGFAHYSVRARLLMLSKHFSAAEDVYTQQGKTQEAMDMYQVRRPGRRLADCDA